MNKEDVIFEFKRMYLLATSLSKLSRDTQLSNDVEKRYNEMMKYLEENLK